MAGHQRPTITIRDHPSLLAVVPYLLGFHPTDSIVALLFHRGRYVAAVRVDLPGLSATAGQVVEAITAACGAVEVDSVVIVGYGPAGPVAAVAETAREVLPARDVALWHVFRVDADRYLPVVCPDGSCPPDGGVFDPASSVVAAEATWAGLVAVPSRDTVAAQVTPVTGAARQAMHEATRTALAGIESLATGEESDEKVRARLVREGAAAVDQALGQQQRPLSDQQAAWLTVLLAYVPVRDYAFAHTGTDWAHVRLWADLARRAEPDLVAAPATLCAFAAWRLGESVLARFAVHRALDADPGYKMAQLVDHLLDLPIPPHRWEEIIADGGSGS